MTLAVARTPLLLRKKTVLCGAWERRAPFNPDNVVEEFAAILKEYRLSTVIGDRYSAEWVVARFRAHNIAYITSEKTKSEIFLEFLALTNGDRVRIPRNRRLRAQLQSLERRVSRGGKDTVDHVVGAHDDLCNAVCGALVLAAATPRRKFHMPHVLTVRCGTAFAPLPVPPPSDAPWRDPHEGVDLNDPFQGDERFWHKQ
jgi:hypothetical protein